MKRFAYPMAAALLGLSAPATAMPNAFWIFGFNFPAHHKPGGFGAAQVKDESASLNRAEPCAAVDACKQPRSEARDAVAYARLQQSDKADAPVTLTDRVGQ